MVIKPKFTKPFVVMSDSRDVSAITVMIGAELLLATVNATVKWAGSWPSVRIMLVRFSPSTCTCTCTCHMHMHMHSTSMPRAQHVHVHAPIVYELQVIGKKGSELQ